MDDKNWTKEEFLKRCETIWNIGLAQRHRFILMERWLDFVLRLEHTLFSVGGQTQGMNVMDFLENEKKRIDHSRTLASDVDGYALVKMIAVLTHSCQICAEDKNAWHTRSGWCPHRDGK